jgi:sulfatase modifying factor 1
MNKPMRKTIFLLISAFLFSGSTLKDNRLRPGKDYALFFAVNDYDYWEDLANPISEVEAIAKDLKDLYGFETEIVRNPDRKAILDKIEDYRKKTYARDAQLLIFFSGHGEFNEATKQGYFVPKNGQKNDTYGDSYIEYEGLKRRISSLPCEHILLALDACYSGTADESIAMRGEPGKRPGANADAERERYISTSLQYRTRLMLTSGAKVRTPDKSQFVEKFLEALRSQGGSDRLVNMPELLGYLTTASPKPVSTTFGDHAPGGEFLFVQGIYSGTDDLVKKSKEAAQGEQDLAAWRTAKSSNTREAYQNYLSRFPSGEFRAQAEEAISAINAHEAAWQKAQSANTIEAYREYLDKFPNGANRTTATEAIRKLEADLAIRRDDLAWDVAVEKNTVDAYKKYQADYPNGRHSTEATAKIKSLEQSRSGDTADGLVFVKGGAFTMGCTGEQGSDCDSDEKPAHQVTLSDFYIGKYEVTQAEWRKVMGSDPPELYNKGCDQCPVEKVSWDDIQEFLKKLNTQTGKQYRLPTEAEWEYAARGGSLGTGYKYAGSNSIDDVAWYNANSKTANTFGDQKTTRPVGQKKANELGLYDMSGNVYEWCSDWKGTYPSSAQTNPVGPSSGSYRVIRGGSWNDVPQVCRVANRHSITPDYRSLNVGFRLARTR